MTTSVGFLPMEWGGHPVIEAEMLAWVKRLADLPDGGTFGPPRDMAMATGIAFHAVVAFGYAEERGPRVYITAEGRAWLKQESGEA